MTYHFCVCMSGARWGSHELHNQLLSVCMCQGLDGEATERMVEHLAEPQSEQRDPESEFRVASVLADQASTGWTQTYYI